MWPVWGFISFLTSTCWANLTPYSYCADMVPQPHINIEQLMGMWYGIEILNHNVEHHYVQIGNSCPVLYFAKDKDYTRTQNPLYKDYNYGYNYGERRPPRPTDRSVQEYDQYGRSRHQPYDRTPNDNNKRYGNPRYNNRGYTYNIKQIIISWFENGTSTDYHLKYNETRPGFWISSGPQNGSELEPLYTNFAGTVQVLKVVGNHMVVTFCHQMPERQLFSVLLSRENTLGKPDIQSVHNLLNRKGLSTTAVRRVCWNGSESATTSLWTLFLSFFTFLLLRF